MVARETRTPSLSSCACKLKKASKRPKMTSAEDVYAIGDAVKFPLPQWNIDSVNIAHFQAAQSHGQMLAYSIEGNPYPHELVPFFMTKFFLEYTIQFAGCPKDADEEIVHGNLSELNFAKYYLKGDLVVAVASSGDIPTAVQFLELFRRKIKITREDLNRNKTRDWMAWLNPKDQ
ncbi:hypothetical protein TELCIR_04660 [Teladorsagia circumcincta]|uniref:Uncharacterized protein n=1 Tax=Teladorsagia circumcincta TaxID=45464 RepID=A0A2G9USX7_TELCI|nr:hypothetical protein TELCIR_04660 [Teladorsagia circumcincta]